MIEITHEFDAPGPQPNGMQATADGIWFLDQKSNQAALVSFTGKTLQTLDTASDRGSGITAAGSELWLASTYDSKILRVDRETGVTLERLDTPGAAATGAHGLEIRDGCLWMAVPPSATIYQVETGERLRCGTCDPRARGPSARNCLGRPGPLVRRDRSPRDLPLEYRGWIDSGKSRYSDGVPRAARDDDVGRGVLVLRRRVPGGMPCKQATKPLISHRTERQRPAGGRGPFSLRGPIDRS